MSKAVLIPECKKDIGGVKEEIRVSPSNKKEGEISLFSRLLRLDTLSKRNSLESPSATEPQTTYYAVYIPCEIKKGPDEETIHVYTDKTEALELFRRYKSARFKAFRNHQDAVSFALRGAEPVDTHEGNGNSIGGEKPYPFRAPSPQDMVSLRKAIEAGNVTVVRDRVWDNPRYLVSSGSTPAILQEGSRYNALHVAAKALNADICNLILTTVGNPAFVQTLYGMDADQDTCKEFATILLDRYLNTPDKAMNETPLHFASKFGAEKVVDVLTSFPQCNKLSKNKYGESAKDIICSRCPSSGSAARIAVLLAERYYVPVLHSEDGSGAPAIGLPFTPKDHPDLNPDPLSPRYEIRAFAGPMAPRAADGFRRRWKTPPRTGFRLTDVSKGLERVGRNLADEMHVGWKEYWAFLDTFTDLRSSEGLELLENYLKTKYETACSLAYNESLNRSHGEDLSISRISLGNLSQNSPMDTVLSPISELCVAMKTCKITDAATNLRKTDKTRRLWPTNKVVANGESPPQTNHTVSQLLCIERTCQVFAKRIADALIFSLTAEPDVAGESLKSEAKHLQHTINTYMDDERFQTINFALIHSRLAQLVVFKLRQKTKELDDINNLVEFLVKLRCPNDDIFSSDDERKPFSYRTNRVKNNHVIDAHVRCASSFICEELTESDITKGPAASDTDCIEIWEKASKCRCDWKIEPFDRNSKKNASFRKNRSILSTSPKSESFIRRLSYDHDIGDGQLHNNETEMPMSVNSPAGDNLYTLDVAKCEVVSAEISDDESVVSCQSDSDAYETAEHDSDDDDMHDASDRALTEPFIHGEEPTKMDRLVFDAISSSDITTDQYPNVYRWRHSVALYPPAERESWLATSLDESVSSVLSWCAGESPRVCRARCSTPQKDRDLRELRDSRDSRDSHADKTLPLQVSSWLRVTGPNSPRSALANKNVSHNEFATILLNRYLNTPDKATNETPLHFASKFGAEKVVDVLTSFPQCNKLAKNKYGESAKDIICSRCPSSGSAARIAVLLAERYYVPVLHSEDGSGAPAIGLPFTPKDHPDLNPDPLSPRYEIRAFAGPMAPRAADGFRRRWKTPPRTGFRLTDVSKGLERVGRNLADEMHVGWKEYWSFLDTFTDLRSSEGLELLENYLKTKYETACSLAYNESLNRSHGDDLSISRISLGNLSQNSPMDTVLSPISELCVAMKTCKITDAATNLRKTDKTRRLWPTNKVVANGESPPQTNHTVSQLLCIERTCQVFAKRIADALIFSLTAEPDVAGESLKSEAKHLQHTINTYMDDERFQTINFALIHSRLAQLVVFKLRQKTKELDDINNLVEFLVKLRCPNDDIFSSDDERKPFSYRTNRVKNNHVIDAHVRCASSFICEELTESDITKGPAASDTECIEIWDKASKCRCDWKIESFDRNSKKNASFRKNRSILSTSPKSESFIRRLSYDHDIGDGQLHNNETEMPMSVNSPAGDNLYTLDVAKCEVVSAEISDDESVVSCQSDSDAYETAEHDSDDDDMHDASDRALTEPFIHGEEPTKMDRLVFDAISSSDITTDQYPNVYRWRHSVALYPPAERESWLATSLDESVSSVLSWCAGESPRVCRARCSTPQKDRDLRELRDSRDSHADKTLPLQVSSWLRVTGPNSPRSALATKNVGHNEFATILLDRYLNTPDKAMNDTPLHFASKFGAEKVVDVLTSFPQCNKLAKNKYGESAKDVICSRCPSSGSAARIAVLLAERYYVPVLHSEDGSGAPAIGLPFTPKDHPDLNPDPLSPRYEIRAFAGPMAPRAADGFRRRWKTPPRTGFRLTDVSKGLERVGRNLADEMHVGWKEYWSFLDTFTDLRSSEGLELLENYLKTKYETACSLAYNESLNRSHGDDLSISRISLGNLSQNSPIDTVLSPISELCVAMKTCKITDAATNLQKTDKTRRLWPTNKVVANGESPPQTNHTVSQLLCIERTCQVFAKRIADALIFSLTAEPDVAGESLKSEAKHLQHTINTYMDDERFQTINFALIHSRLAQLVVFKLRQKTKELDDINNLVEFLVKLRCPNDDIFSSDDERKPFSYRTNRVKNNHVIDAHVRCASSFICEELTESDITKGPAASDTECIEIWEKASKCRCDWKIESFDRNSKKNASFRKNRSILSTSPKSESFIRRLSYDHDIGDGQLHNNETEMPMSVNSPAGDNLYTLDVAKCEVVSAEISDDESVVSCQSDSDAYETAEHDSDDDDMHDASDRALTEPFIHGEEPTKMDRLVFDAISSSDITTDQYPNVYRWRHSVALYPPAERESWLATSLDESVSSVLSWCAGESPRVCRARCSTPQKDRDLRELRDSRDSRDSHADKTLPLQVSSWLRVTGPNSPRSALATKNVSHNVSFGF